MKKIVLLSSNESEDYIHDDHVLEKALRQEGLQVLTKPWESLKDEGEDLFLIRTTWNYTEHLEEFFKRLAPIQERLLNPLPLVKWNSNKKYLLELEKNGVPVMPLKLACDLSELNKAIEELGGDEFIVKPVIGAGAKGLKRFKRSSPPEIAEEMIVQKFFPDIVKGELSFIFFGGEFSHAIRKTPVEGEIRVQEEFGGVVTAHGPTSEEMKMALSALENIPMQWLYARVDIVPGAGIIEVECVEPSLFFGSDADAATNFVKALKSRL